MEEAIKILKEMKENYDIHKGRKFEKLAKKRQESIDKVLDYIDRTEQTRKLACRI